jgi:ABC-type branched-subunit amino acid transport system ATPase component
MGELLFSMEGIEKSFPGVHALNQARFDLRAGEIHALVGENGAGKSTLMKVFAGIYRKDAGRIIYKGREVDIPNPAAAQNLGISMIHQELNLMPHLTVAQNIFIGREPRRRIKFILDDRLINEQARQLIEMMHLKLDPRTRVADLTVAKQQMVEIAKALSFNSEVLIMDEPTAALTDAEIEELFRIIRQLRDKGVGIVYIIIQAHPNLKGFFGANEGSIIGVLNAVKELGKEGKIVVIGYDSGQQQLDAIRSGVEAGAITQDPIGIGYKCVEAAVKAIKGESLPKTIDTGFHWYDKTNIDSPEIAPLLYK